MGGAPVLFPFSFYYSYSIPMTFIILFFIFQCVRPLFVWIWVSWPFPLGVSGCKMLWGLLSLNSVLPCWSYLLCFPLNLDQRSQINTIRLVTYRKRVEKITLHHVFKMHLGSAPSYMNEYVVPASSVHSQNTRFSKGSCFSIPKVKGFGKKYFSYIKGVLYDVKKWRCKWINIQR